MDYMEVGRKTHVSENILVQIIIIKKNVAMPVPTIYYRISEPDAVKL